LWGKKPPQEGDALGKRHPGKRIHFNVPRSQRGPPKVGVSTEFQCPTKGFGAKKSLGGEFFHVVTTRLFYFPDGLKREHQRGVKPLVRGTTAS